MSITYLVASALLASQQQQAAPQLPPSPIIRIEIAPRARTLVAGDSMRLQARALDANGQPVPGAVIHFTMRGGQMEGSIDSTGFVVGSTIGKLPFNVTAVVPGTRPVIDSVDFR